MHKYWKPFSYLLTLLLGVVLTLAFVFILLLYSRIAPADDGFRQACPHFSTAEIREKYIQSWLRSAGKDSRKAAIGLEKLTFVTAPTFDKDAWFGKLQVSGSNGSEEAYVILDCKTGMYEYSGTEKSAY